MSDVGQTACRCRSELIGYGAVIRPPTTDIRYPTSMCGRFGLTRPDKLDLQRYGIDEIPPQTPRFNIPPSSDILVVRERKGVTEAEMIRWGLVPSWAKDPSIGNRMANVRSDTALEKPTFRAAMQKRRCLIPADVFYEWQDVPGQKRRKPYAVALRDGEIFALGGIWEAWRAKESGEWVITCAILTTEPNELLATIHDRMPVMIRPEDYRAWIDPSVQMGDVSRLVAPFPAEEMRTWEIGLLVNDPKTDDARVIAPVD
jgi:putative SOS response-associated peptidase YedK